MALARYTVEGLAEADAKQAAAEASSAVATVSAEVADPAATDAGLTVEGDVVEGDVVEGDAPAGVASTEPAVPSAAAVVTGVAGSPGSAALAAAKQNTLYELAGVVVHSGLASAGHYYSFIRVRDPPGAEGPHHGKWVEFNDTVVKFVSMTDAEMEAQFFGGKYTPDVGDYYATETDRFWFVVASFFAIALT
jgi:hypothetical protein